MIVRYLIKFLLNKKMFFSNYGKIFNLKLYIQLFRNLLII